MKKQKKSSITTCIRCGTCCQKGGPALHDDDLAKVETGVIPLPSLYTIRKGETVRDNINGGMMIVEDDIVKIKSISGSDACIYYDDDGKACRIYENRLFECRTMECWDTSAIINVYSSRRLNRAKILASVQWILEMVTIHESRCPFGDVRRLVGLREKGDDEAAVKLQDMVNEDAHFRHLLVNKGNIAPDMLEFLLGRPLADIIRLQFNIKVEQVKPV